MRTYERCLDTEREMELEEKKSSGDLYQTDTKGGGGGCQQEEEHPGIDF